MVFYKMHGAGNDFVMIEGKPHLDNGEIAQICRHRTGVGADGLIFVEKSEGLYSFIMHYYNADGSEAKFCGNGARCAVYFAKHLKMFDGINAQFIAKDGPHSALITEKNDVLISITKPSEFEHIGQLEDLPFDLYFVNTGVEHVVIYVDNLSDVLVDKYGALIRYNQRFPKGTNVNFIQKDGESIRIRTYERGVEGETLACGTGISAAAFVDMELSGERTIREVITKDEFYLSAGWQDQDFVLIGPAKILYRGELF